MSAWKKASPMFSFCFPQKGEPSRWQLGVGFSHPRSLYSPCSVDHSVFLRALPIKEDFPLVLSFRVPAEWGGDSPCLARPYIASAPP